MASRRDCVIIPDFGAVLGSWRSSYYDAESETLMPPRREFSFNPELRTGDGLLASSLARAEGVSYEMALRMVREDVESMWQQLRSYGDVPLGKLGVLHFSQEDNLVTFTPFASDRLSPATAWLCPVAAKEAIVEARRKSEDSAPVVRFRPLRRAMRIAASIAVLLGVGMVVSTPISVPGDVTYASLSPVVEQVSPDRLVPSLTVPEARTLTMEKSHDADLWIEVAAPAPAAPAPASDMDGKYCVIVSSHASEAEAQRFMAKYSEREMRVLEKDGRFRVYAATAPTMADADALRGSLSDAFPTAWVCRR